MNTWVFDDNIEVILVDNSIDKSYELNEGSKLSFDLNESNFSEDRFSLVFRESNVLSTKIEVNSDIFISLQNDQMRVHYSSNSMEEVFNLCYHWAVAFS